MSEIEKMYELAGIKEGCILPNLCRYKGICAKPVNCEHYDYPFFTAEKQLEIVCFLINRGVELSFNCEQGKINMQAISRGLAGIVNRIWQDLAPEEKEQVKGILE